MSKARFSAALSERVGEEFATIFHPESAPRQKNTARDGRMILKAELHCHIEGAAAPDLVVSQARKYG
ncbi:MAG: hypothetical protein E5W99_17750, partial [Mesorhizobium sp.]